MAEHPGLKPGWEVVPLTPRSPDVELEELRLMVAMLLGSGKFGEPMVVDWSSTKWLVSELGYGIRDVRPPAARR